MEIRHDRTTDIGSFDGEAALDLIREVLSEMVDGPAPIERNTRIDSWIHKRGEADSADLLELTFRLEKAFGVRMTNKDWDDLSRWNECKSRDAWEAKYARDFTFGRVADLLARRASITRLQPMTICGSTCLAAGAFQIVERESRQFTTDKRAFGPSTPILERIHPRRVPQFWDRVRLHNPSQMPRFDPNRGRGITAFPESSSGIALCLFIAALGSAALSDLAGLRAYVGTVMYALIFAGATLMATVTLAMGLILLGNSIDALRLRWRAEWGMLPAGVKTFGDLARLIADERGGWCEGCGYDLTDVTSAVCPECGRETQ